MASSDHASKIREQLQCELNIFVKDIRDRHGKKRPLTVRTWSTIKDVKDQLQQLIHVPPSRQRLYFGPLIVKNKELPNYRALQDAGVYRSGDILFLDIASNSPFEEQASVTSLSSSAVSDICVSSSTLDLTPRCMRRIVQQARRGLALGIKPELVLDGSGGTYYLHDTRKVKVAVFKPADEEPYAENNPRGYVKQGATNNFYNSSENSGEIMSLRDGISPGESCLREVAAYLLDHGGFSSVPMTSLAEARHPAFNTNGARLKLAEGGAAMGSHSLTTNMGSVSSQMKKVGSCQEFVNAECSMDDLSPTKIDVDEVHKIAILDIRILNADRNAANLLCRRRQDNSLELVPIDHGFALRAAADIAWFDWCWLDWPQMKKPLSQKSKDYILNLDIEADVRLLEDNLRIGTEALDYFRASSRLLKAGVKAGLSLHAIASICSRQDSAGLNSSTLENIYSQARELSTSATENGRWHHAAASRALENQLSIVNPIAQMSHNPVHRSRSTVNFSTIFLNESTSKDAVHTPSAMPMSGSDSSSDTGDQLLDQEDDCDEWAATILANVQVNDDDARIRSHSFNSLSSGSTSDHLSSGALGFWVVRPGEDDDDDSWDDDSSSSEEEDLSSSMSRRVSSLTSSQYKDDSCVTIEDDPKSAELDMLPEIEGPQRKTSRGMVRSQSCSTFSFQKIAIPSMKTSVHRNSSAESDKCCSYFYKFIDLLIERETTVASLRTKN